MNSGDGRKVPVVLALALGLSSGCAVGPRYRRPALEVPQVFRGQAAAEQSSFADTPWWDVFKDEALKGLIKTALADNYDVRIAVARMDQAQAVAMEARGSLLPQFGYEGAASRGRNSFLGNPTLARGVTGDSYLGAFTAGWEVDFWGRLRRLDEAARAQYLASEEGRRATTLSLVSAVAQSYFQLLALDKEMEIAKRTRASFEQSLDLFNRRFQGGVASKLEVARGEGARATVAAEVPELERQVQLQENVINVLLGRGPGPVARTATLLDQTFPPEIPAGLPSALIERRPDIRGLEQLVRAANAKVGASLGDFLPKINLSGFYGGVSTKLSELTIPHSGAETWAGQGSVSGPLFTGGRLLGEYRQNKASWEEAKLRYQQLVSTAFREVADALVSRVKFDEARAEQEKSVQAYTDAVKVSLERYVAGKAGYFEVLEAQQQLFPAEVTLAQIQLSRLLSVVQLYRALGGGWDLQQGARKPL